MTAGDGAIAPDANGRSAWPRAVAVGLVLASLAFLSTGHGRQLFDVTMRAVFPRRVTMQVAPGNVHIRIGSALGINARVVGGGIGDNAQVEMGDNDRWQTVDMTTDKDGRFRLRLDAIESSFKYRVIAGSVTSPTYSVVVADPPRVTHIGVNYAYPDTTGLKPRHEDGRGDIDGPVGTNVQVCVYVDRPASVGVLALATGERITLNPVSPTELSGSLTIAANAAYRVVLADADGIRNDGDTEYFIRALPSAAERFLPSAR